MDINGRVVIIGGDAAGMSAAAKIRREQPERNILVLEKTEHTSYSACGIPYYIGGLIDELEQLIARTPEIFRKKYNIDVRAQHEVIEIYPKEQRVLIKDSKNKMIKEPYDELLIATGAIPICPEVPGYQSYGIFGLCTLSSGQRVYDFIKKEKPKKAVVVGGGYIGLEMAEALIRQGLEVSLVQRDKEVMGTLDHDMGKLVSDALRNVGVTLYLSETMQSFDAHHGQVKAVVTDQRTLPADIVILGMGVEPNTKLAQQAGIKLGVKEAIKVDKSMRTETDHIWAAGDCATSIHRLSGQQIHIALGTVANKHGLVAGTNLAGGQASFPGVMGTAVSKICKVEVARTGLQGKELDHLKSSYQSVTIRAKTRAGYFPGVGQISVKLLGEEHSGRLLGAQIVGMEGAAKRIDVIATALTAGMSVQDLIDMDLSYAPPFSPVWDPVQTAARQLIKKL